MDNRTPSERFWVKVNRLGPDDCWPWRAHIARNGYGGFRYQGKSQGAHRFAYVEQNGAIPDGLVVSCAGGPTCQHRRCVNPAHLRAVPQSTNLGSSPHTVNYASTNATHCPKGHPYAGDNLRFDGADRYCAACKRVSQRAAELRRAGARRERYALLRAAGLSSREAQSASKAKVAVHCGRGDDSALLA